MADRMDGRECVYRGACLLEVCQIAPLDLFFLSCCAEFWPFLLVLSFRVYLPTTGFG